MAHDVFISHSTEDKTTADAVCAILEKNGVRCWIAPRDIMPGADWSESIVNGIRRARVLLLVFSTHANKSKQIKREVEIAADGGVTIIPLRIENTLPTESFKYFLGNIHWLDALTPPLEKHLQDVAAKVKAILAMESTASTETSRAPLTPQTPLPGRRNLLPAMTGIFVVLIAALVFLLFWRREPASLAPSPTPAASVPPVPASASAPLPSVSPASTTAAEAVSTPTAVPSTSISEKQAMILGILRAIETHDWRAFLAYTMDQQIDYFGHKNASNAFIQQDIERDAKSYKWFRFVPDLSTFQTSPGHDSIEYQSDALDLRGQEHKARCRLDIYYTPTLPSRLQSISLKVLGT
jgi:TIR domain